MNLIVHHLNNSRSQRILWLIEEIGAPYAIKFYDRNPQTNLAPPELLAVHSLGKSPVIEDEGRVVVESGAITEYLCERHRSEEHTSELQSLMRNSYAVFCLQKNNTIPTMSTTILYEHNKQHI